jgi:RNA polymerase sigma factor (sigma-70 family)
MPADRNADDLTWNSLLSRAANGDEEAWSEIHRHYTPYVNGWCLRFGMRDDRYREDRADVTSEVFLALTRRCRKNRATGISGTARALRTFLYVLTYRRCMDVFRARAEDRQTLKAARDGFDSALDASALLELLLNDPESVEDREFLPVIRCLKTAIAALKSVHWEAFRLVVLEEKSTEEVSSRLNLSPNNVRVIRHRVGAKLKESLDQALKARLPDA